jgi:NADPH-dependent ferric siderophore reductase
MSFSSASVIETVALSAHLRRITLHVDDPAALAVRPGGDSAVGVYFSADGAATEGRNYSVRRHRGDRIDLDVVLHARGAGTAWAATARAGDRVGLDHARSWYRPEPTSDWQLLVADLSGLPAAARIIEELPEGRRATAVVEVLDAADLDYLPDRPAVTVVPSIGTGNGRAPSRLADLVRTFPLPDGRGYCWFAGEAAESRSVRKHFRGLGWSIEQLDVTGYWRFDSESWDERFALVEDEATAVWTQALADGKDERTADEEFDEALERLGL